jgi:hypothetical protein
MPGRKIFYRGDEFLSTGMAATMLGVSTRTVHRYRRAGMLFPADVPRGIRGQHWYLLEDVQKLAEMRSDGVLAPRDGKDASGRLSFSDYARPGKRSVRAVDDDDGDGWHSPAEERDAYVEGGVGEATLSPVEPLACPTCGSELLTVSAGIPGARPGLKETLWCERCDEKVVVSEPKEPDENMCPHCQSEMVWEQRDDGEAGWQGRCDVHGVVALCDLQGVVEGRRRGKKVVQEPYRSTMFSAPRPALPARPRGLTHANVVAAVRKPRPRPSPGPTWLPPYELGH